MTGQELRKERERAGIGQSDLAREIGMTRQSVATIESTPEPTDRTVLKILQGIENITARSQGRESRKLLIRKEIEYA